MRRKTVLRFGIAIAAILVLASIAIGALQADEELREDKDSPTPTPTVVAISQPDPDLTAEEAQRLAAPYVPPELPADYPPAPPREYELTGSDILYRVRGGDDPCRFLYTNNRVGTHVGEIGIWFVAGVWKADLAYGDEMHLYGANGPHLFYFKDSTGQAFAMTEVPRGATVYVSVTFPVGGVYYLFDRKRRELGAVGEIMVSPVGPARVGPRIEWCPS